VLQLGLGLELGLGLGLCLGLGLGLGSGLGGDLVSCLGCFFSFRVRLSVKFILIMRFRVRG